MSVPAGSQSKNTFVRNQKNRPTNKPTMKRVFFFFLQSEADSGNY
jgi:hypothetical protein